MTDGSIPVGTTGEKLNTSIVTTGEGEVHNEVIDQGNYISPSVEDAGGVEGNSRDAATLAAAGIFQGVSEEVHRYGRVGIAIRSDNATDGSLTIEVSHDNVIWSGPTRTLSDTRFSQPLMWNIVEKYFRIKYVNGSTEAQNLSIQVQYSNNADILLAHPLNETLISELGALLVRAVAVGPDLNDVYRNVQTIRVDEKTSLYTVAGFTDTDTIHLDVETDSASIAFMLIDLSNDSEKWKHVNTGEVIIEYILLEVDPSDNFVGEVKIGYLDNVDATNGDFHQVMDIDMRRKADLIIETIDFGSHGIHMDNDHHFGPVLSDSTLFQTDVAIEGPDGSTYNSGNGDVVLLITATNFVDVSITIGYETVRPSAPSFDYFFADDSGMLSSDVSFTRATSATHYNSSGVLQVPSSGTARVDSHGFNGSNWINQGLIIEGAKTNVQIRSNELDNAAWTKIRSTIVANQANGPDGTAVLEELVEDSTASSTHYIRDEYTGLADNTIYTNSYAIRANTRSIVYVLIKSKDGSENRVWFDLSAGTKGTQDAGIVDADIIDLSGGLYRIWASADLLSGGGTVLFGVGTATSDGSSSHNGDITKSIYLAEALIEPGSFPSSIIRTSFVDATRAADVATITRTPPAAYSIILRARTGLGAGVLWSWDDGTADERVYVERNSSNEIRLRGVAGGVEQFNILAGTVADETDFAVAFRIALSDVAVSLDGVAVVTDICVTLPTVTTQRIGMDRANTNHWNSTIERLTEWAVGLTDDELRSEAT